MRIKIGTVGFSLVQNVLTYLKLQFILFAVVGNARPVAAKALSGLATVQDFCVGKGPLDSVEDLASEAFGAAHPTWTGTEVGASFTVLVPIWSFCSGFRSVLVN